MKRIVLSVCVLLLLTTVALAGQGYIIFLKNGKFIRAKEPMKIQGKSVLIVLDTGTLAQYPLQLVDLVETERYNQLGLGNAYLIEELTVQDKGEATPTPTPSLSDMVGTFGLDHSPDASQVTPTPTPTPGISLKGTPYKDGRVVQAFTQIFDEKKLYVYRTSVGTKPEFLFVQAVTDQDEEVFNAIKIVAEAFKVIHDLHPEMAPEAVELQMIQTSGKPAGTFRLSPELATEVADKETTVEQFYVQNVIF